MINSLITYRFFLVQEEKSKGIFLQKKQYEILVKKSEKRQTAYVGPEKDKIKFFNGKSQILKPVR